MKHIRLILVLGAVSVLINSASMAQEQKAAEAGKVLRGMILSASPDRLGFKPDKAFPKVYGMFMNWNIGDQTAGIQAMMDGTASLTAISSVGVVP